MFRKQGVKMWAPKGRSTNSSVVLLVAAHMVSPLRWHQSWAVGSLQGTNVLESPMYLWLNSRWLYTAFSWTPCLTFQVFLWNLNGSLSAPTTSAFCMPVKPKLHGKHQDLLSVEAVAKSHWTMTSVTSQYLDGLGQWNQLLRRPSLNKSYRNSLLK